MGSETNGGSLKRKLKKHPLEHKTSAFSDVFMENKRQNVCAIRDFPEGCGPFIKPIVLAHSMKYKPPVVRDFPWGCGHGSISMQSNVLSEKDEDDVDNAQIESFEDAVELHSPRVLKKISETEVDCFLTEEEDNDSMIAHFGNALESPLHKGLEDFAQSELPCKNSETGGKLEDFA